MLSQTTTSYTENLVASASSIPPQTPPPPTWFLFPILPPAFPPPSQSLALWPPDKAFGEPYCPRLPSSPWTPRSTNPWAPSIPCLQGPTDNRQSSSSLCGKWQTFSSSTGDFEFEAALNLTLALSLESASVWLFSVFDCKYSWLLFQRLCLMVMRWATLYPGKCSAWRYNVVVSTKTWGKLRVWGWVYLVWAE